MTDTMLDPRITAWLDDGPSRAPDDAFDAIVAVVATTPSLRPVLHVGSRPVFRQQLAAAAVILVTVLGAGIVLRQPLVDVVSPPPVADDLLADHPETRTILSTQGGPSAEAERSVVGVLPRDRALVVAAACTGPGDIRVEVLPNIQVAPGEPPLTPYRQVAVPCDGPIGELVYATVGDGGMDELQLIVDADAGVTWRLAMGELRDTPAAPVFPATDPGEGRLLLTDGPPMLSNGEPTVTGGIGFDPRGATSVVALVQCLGDPVTVWASTGSPGEDEITGSPIERLTCDDASVTTEVPLPGAVFGNVRAVSEGFTWTRLAAAAATDSRPARAAAPALPDGLGDTWFAEGDGEAAAFGRLGSNEQQIVRIDGLQVGEPGGEFVAIATPDGDGGTALDLWSIPEAAPVARLATLDGAQVFGSWVDVTHRQVFYGRSDTLGVFRYHRVGFDGSGDVEIAGTPIGGLEEAQAGLAIDDTSFMTQWCPRVGDCERVVYDAATGEVTNVDRGNERMCGLYGIAGDTMVGMTPSCDVAGGVSAEPLSGGDRIPLSDGAQGLIVPTADGPRVALLTTGDTTSTLSVVGLDGTGSREVATFEHESGSNPYLSDLRLPAPGWVLLAGSLADTPTNPVLQPRAMLVNLETGERIELANLPGGDTP
jgi:hypothetical protein